MLFNKCHAIACNHDNHRPLRYYYDDDWGVKGSKVWVTDDEGIEHTLELQVCLSCGTVFVKEYNDIR